MLHVTERTLSQVRTVEALGDDRIATGKTTITFNMTGDEALAMLDAGIDAKGPEYRALFGVRRAVEAVIATQAEGQDAQAEPDVDDDGDVVELPEQDETPVPVAEVDVELRRKAAKAESVAKKAAIKAGDSVPATPNLDAIEAEAAKVARKPSGARAAKVASTAPKTVKADLGFASVVGDGTRVLFPCRNDKHQQTVLEAIGRLGKADGTGFSVKLDDGDKLVAKLAAEIKAETRQFPARLLTISFVQALHAFPDAEATGRTAKAVKALNRAGGWTMVVRSDATVGFTSSKVGTDVGVGAVLSTLAEDVAA